MSTTRDNGTEQIKSTDVIAPQPSFEEKRKITPNEKGSFKNALRKSYLSESQTREETVMFLDGNNHSLRKKRKKVTYTLQGEVMKKKKDQ